MKSRLQLFRNLTLALSLCGLITACDVHEMPDIPENEPFVIRLNFDTDMTPWHHTVKKTEVAEMSLGDPAPSMSDKQWYLRCVVCVYPFQNGPGLARSPQFGCFPASQRRFRFDKPVCLYQLADSRPSLHDGYIGVVYSFYIALSHGSKLLHSCRLPGDLLQVLSFYRMIEIEFLRKEHIGYFTRCLEDDAKSFDFDC